MDDPREVAIGYGATEDDFVYIGCDKTLNFHIKNAAGTAAVDIAGQTIVFDLRDKDTSTTARISKTASVVGVFNADPALNTQRAQVPLLDTDLQWTGIKEKAYRYSVKRTDDGSEQPYNYGDCYLTKLTAP